MVSVSDTKENSMYENFFARKEELKEFRAFFRDDESNLALLYGRKGVGKSALLSRALLVEHCHHVYLVCSQTNEQTHLDQLRALGAQALKQPTLEADRLEDVLDTLAEHAQNIQMVVVLGEYPRLREVVPECDKRLQEVVDRWRGQSKFKLVLTGSNMSVMKDLTKPMSPFYGRFSLNMKLEPLNYQEAAECYQDMRLEDKLRLFSVFGGMPAYIRMIDPKQSAEENIQSLLISQASVIDNEVTLMLSSEFSKLNNVNLVLTALAKGIGKFTDILEATKIAKSPTLADCLARLTAMGLVVKDAPINDERNKRRVIYRIADPMTAFYYRFVFPKKSLLQIYHYRNFFEDFVKDEFENEYMPLALEEVVRQFLTLRNKAGLIDPPLTRMGRYVYQLPSMRRPREIRFVTEDQNGYCYYDLSFKPKEMKVESVVRTIEQVKASPLDARRFVFFVRKREYWYDYRLNEVSVEQHTVHEFYTKMQ